MQLALPTDDPDVRTGEAVVEVKDADAVTNVDPETENNN